MSIHKNNIQIPTHLAIIMDGNGRWAKQKGMLRVFGHEKGANAVKESIEGAGKSGIEYLTLYAFSTENWNRPKSEVEKLMNLLVSTLKKELKNLNKNNVKLNAIGNLDQLPQKAKNQLQHVIEETKNNKKLTLTLALSYGSRDEIVKSVKKIALKVKNNIISEEMLKFFAGVIDFNNIIKENNFNFWSRQKCQEVLIYQGLIIRPKLLSTSNVTICLHLMGSVLLQL